jgi:ATP-dependent helicase/nuclease subunit A
MDPRPPARAATDAVTFPADLELAHAGARPQPGEPRRAWPDALPRELILASAGSGKTFRISSRLIALLARGEAAEAVFASTFTRKAAGEILDRVLLRLAAASLDEDAARELAAHASLHADPDAARPAFWMNVLEGTVRTLHRLNVGTLDAFFVRAVGSFAPDLGLPAGWRIADDAAHAQLAALALQDVLTVAEPDVVVEVVRAMAGGRAARSVHDALLRQVADLMRVVHAIDPSAAGVWSAFDADAGERSTPAQRGALAARMSGAGVPLTKGGTPNQVWAKALVNAARLIDAGDWGGLLESTLCKAAVAGADFNRTPVPPAVAQLFDEACVLARTDLATRLADQSRALEAFGRLYGAALERRRREAGLYGFDDLTRLMGGSAAIAGREDLYYRLDGRIRHVLLDEFQDTSAAQWEALQPLMDELLSSDDGTRAAVIVADPKQSIYGWRGGAPELVELLLRRGALAPDALSTSWRSSPVVLDAVNRVFSALPALPAWQDDGVAGDVVTSWLSAFASHSAARPELAGHVRIVAGPADEGTGQDRPRLCRAAAELVAGLHAAMPGRGIGVLTRRNVTVARMMMELKRLGVLASEEGGNALTDAAPVTSLLALLRAADHPGNTVARYHVASTPVGEVLAFTDHSDDGAARSLSRRIRRRLVGDGYGRTLADLADRIRPYCDAREARRLAQLVELAFRYEPSATLRPSDFVAWIATQRVEDPVAADVRVMTVHQSKGLEFDVVVLPEMDAPLTRSGGGGPMAYRPAPVARVTRVFPYVNAAVLPLFSHIPEIAAAAAQSRSAELRDALSTMYVAMTRARHAVHVVVRPDGPNGPGKARTAARLLREALAPSLDTLATGDVLFEAGDPAWHGTLPAALPAMLPGTAAARAASSAVRLRQAPHRSRVLPRRSPSGLEGGGATDLAMVLRLGAGAARVRGSIAHLWLEQLAWIEDGLPDDGRLRELARSVSPDIDAAELDALVARLHAWLAAPAVRQALSRASWPARANVENEVPFLHRDGEILLEGVIDRLVTLRGEDGTVTGACIIDYKTDALDGADAAALQARRAYYAPQLEAYRRAVAHMYGLAAADIRAQLVFLECGAVLDVAAAVEDAAADAGESLRP